MSAVRRSLRQVATIAARRGAVAVAEASPARAIVAGELQVSERKTSYTYCSYSYPCALPTPGRRTVQSIVRIVQMGEMG